MDMFQRLKTIIICTVVIPLFSVSDVAIGDEYDAVFNPRSWIQPQQKKGIFLGFPLTTITPILGPEDTDGRFSASIEEIETDYFGPAHVHYKKDVTIILIDGSAHVRVNDSSMTLDEGQWIHIPAGNVHSFKSTGNPAKWIILQNSISGPLEAVGDAEELCDELKYVQQTIVVPTTRWYGNCAPDFYMVPKVGAPYDPK